MTRNRRPAGKPDRDRRYIYRATIRLRSGRLLVAAHYGLRAFKIPVQD